MTNETVAQRLVTNALSRYPHSTGLELWNVIVVLCETPDDKKLLKIALPHQDQSVRNTLANLAKKKMVLSRPRKNSILLEWRLA